VPPRPLKSAQEGADRRRATGGDSEAGRAGQAPLFVGKPFQVGDTAEQLDGAEHLAKLDGDKQRQRIQKRSRLRAIQPAQHIFLEAGQFAADGLVAEACQIGQHRRHVVCEFMQGSRIHVIGHHCERDLVGRIPGKRPVWPANCACWRMQRMGRFFGTQENEKQDDVCTSKECGAGTGS
jgi:hypothetical protein